MNRTKRSVPIVKIIVTRKPNKEYWKIFLKITKYKNIIEGLNYSVYNQPDLAILDLSHKLYLLYFNSFCSLIPREGVWETKNKS